MPKPTAVDMAAVVTMALLGVASCADSDTSSDEFSDAERAEIASAVEARHQDLLDVWAEEDAFDAWMALHADEDHFSWVDERNLLTVSGVSYGSQAEIDSAFREILSDRSTQVTMRDEYVAVLSPSAAVHFGEFTWTATRDGVSSEEYAASATTIWVLEGGEWKILHHHQSWPSTTPVPAG